MPTLPQVNQYYALIGVFIVSFSAFIFVFGYTIYYWLHKRHHPKKNGPTIDPRDTAVQESIRIVDSARSKAMELLKEAHFEAKTILSESSEIQSSTKELFEQKMQQVSQKQMQAFDLMSQELLGTYKTVLMQEKESSLRSLEDVSGALKSELTSEVRSFVDRLNKVTTETESSIRQDMQVQYAQVSSQMTALAESLRGIAEEAENSMKSNLGGQYSLVQNEISSLSENIKKVTQEAEDTIKSELLGQYDKLKLEVSDLSQSLKSVTEETENKIRDEMDKDLGEARGVIHDFSENIKKATIDTENTLKQDVKNEYDRIVTDLNTYREQKMQKIDDTFKGMLEEVARDVLGKSMTAKDHEELIIKSLDNIKRTTNFKEL